MGELGIDSFNPEKHNIFRGLPGAFEGALAGIEACKRNGLQFQIHFQCPTHELSRIAHSHDWAHDFRAKVLNVFLWSARVAGRIDRYHS